MSHFINSLIEYFSAQRLFALLLSIGVFLFLGVTQSTLGQQFILHNSFTEEDGDAAKDADGVIGQKNGTVVWKGGGTVHVITWGYDVRKDQTLEIKPGAIVKIASEFLLDTSGNLSSWKPGGGIYFRNGATFLVDHATITDIRDDEGGDTNLDGNLSSPPNFGTSAADFYTFYFEAYGGLINGYIKNSTVKYATLYGRIPVTTDNKFLVFNEWEFKSSYYLPDPLLVRVVSRNLFEFATNKSRLDCQGSSPIISGNTFRYSSNAKNPAGYNNMAILIGPAAQGEQKIILPTSGITTISDNLFETEGGIYIAYYAIPDQDLDDALARFSVEIRYNTFRGVGLPPGESSAYGHTCLTLDFRANITITNNQFSRYTEFLKWSAGSSSAYGNFRMNYNHFERDGALGLFATYSFDKYWKNGIFMNAENNYWADPSGPNDYSDADGLQNRRGKGIIINDGWDYVPFIGGTTPPSKDAIHINAIHSLYPLPMLPSTSPTVDVNVDNYKLESANTGKITVLIRDAEGYILNQPGSVVSVTSQNISANIPAIQFTVPELSPLITVEALLIPDGDLPETTSNIEPFVVKLPASSLSIISIKGVPDHGIVPGNESKPTISLNYTLVTSSPTTNGTIEFELKEVNDENHNVINIYPIITVSVPPGTNKTLDKELTIDIPLLDVKNKDYFKRTLTLFLKLKDDKGVNVGSANKNITIDDIANDFGNVSMIPAIDIGNGQLVEAGRKHFLIGEIPGFIVNFSVNIKTEHINNWQVWLSPTEYIDKANNIVLNIYQINPSAEQLSTGFTQKKAAISLKPIPSGVIYIGQSYELDSPSPQITVRKLWYNFDVRQAAQVSQKAIPKGTSQNSFNPIPVSLNFSANQNTGTAFAEEFAGQYSSSSAKVNQNQLMKSTAAWYWELIPLNKYWSVYDTLKENTFSANISFTYDPATDFPSVPGFNEDSLVITGLNPLSGELEALPSTLDKSTHTITTEYTKFFDTWVVASKATEFVTSVSSDMSDIPERFALFQNYPNPFNPSTKIKYTVAAPLNLTQWETWVRLKVYDILGNEVATLVDEEKLAGNYEVVFSANVGGSNLTSGIYFYRLQAGEFSSTKKIILMK